MRSEKLDRALAIGVVAIAVFNTAAALTLPVRERKPALLVVGTWMVLLLAHAALYWFGPSLRARFGVARYVAAQAAVVFLVGLSGALFPVGISLYIALTAQAVLLVGNVWGSVTITVGATALFAVNAAIMQDLYRGATAGLLLATAGVIAHAVMALVRRASPPAALPAPAALERVPAEPVPVEESGLTARELEVLRALTTGARTTQIAADLGIADRTVKSHLASIYQKLGVESRSAAVALALRRRLVDA